jgi:hypothetical protein
MRRLLAEPHRLPTAVSGGRAFDGFAGDSAIVFRSACRESNLVAVEFAVGDGDDAIARL